MFTALAKERQIRNINSFHNKLIRESVVDLIEDDETNESYIGTDHMGLEDDVPQDVANAIESKVDDVISSKELHANMTEEELDTVADDIVNGLNILH